MSLVDLGYPSAADMQFISGAISEVKHTQI